MAIPDLAITSLETISAFDLTTGSFLWILDELQSATLEQSEDSTDITGRAGRRLATLKRNKTVTISASNGLVSAGLMATQTGGAFSNTATEVQWMDYLVVKSQAAATTWKAYGTAGSEIQDLYIRNSDGTLGTKLVQDSSAAAGKFTYNPSTKALGFYTDIADDTEIVVFYKRHITADVLSNSSAAFSGKVSLYIDALGEDPCGSVYRIQFYIPKADFSGNFSLELGGDQTVHSFEASALAGYCGSNGAMWTYTVFGANDPDAPNLSSIAVTTAPTDVTYSVGESFNASGMVITATYSDGSSHAVTGYTVAPVTPLVATDTAVTITYTEGGITKTTTQAITVS